LSRKVGEQILLGDNALITVVAIRANQIRLGFTAPEEVSIRRAEICFELPPVPEGDGRSQGGTKNEPTEVPSRTAVVRTGKIVE
jgi:carbon storage regulator